MCQGTTKTTRTRCFLLRSPFFLDARGKDVREEEEEVEEAQALQRGLFTFICTYTVDMMVLTVEVKL